MIKNPNKCFYCHVKNGKRVVTEKKPENFFKLQHISSFSAPNKEIAMMVYVAILNNRYVDMEDDDNNTSKD